MNIRYVLFVFVFFIGLCSFIFTSFYEKAKQESIKNLNTEQLLYARQAARGIEDFFTGWTMILTTLSETSHIKNMDKTGKDNIENLYKNNSEMIRAVTRVDSSGRIIYTAPYNRNAIGRDISSQKHIREIMNTRKPVISDVFSAVQGYSTVAIHVPVFKNKTYQGTIAIAINFQSLAKRYLEVIKIGKTGYAWVISRDGTELFCPIPGHVGNSVFENCKNFPSILTMAQEMLKGHEGVTIYTFDKIRGEAVDVVKKHAVYIPINIGSTFWSIVVASSEDDVLNSLKGFRNKLIVIVGVLLLGGILFSCYGLKAWFIMREEEKRSRAEKSLRESEETLHAFFDAVHETMVLIDTKGIILLSNAVGAQRLGKDVREFVGTCLYDHFPQDIAGFRKEKYNTVIATGKPVYFQDNRAGRFFEQHCFPVFDGEGDVSGVAIFAHEITERKQAEELLKESEERYRVLVEYSNDGVALIEGDHHIYVNQKFLDIFGYEKPEDIIGKSPFMIVHPDDREMVLEHNRKRQIGEQVSPKYEFKGVKKDGTTLFIEVSATKIVYNGKAVSLAYLRDITERKRMEQQLHKMSFTDELTGIYNRRGFFVLSEQQLKVAERTKKDMLLFFVDMDRMKQINDTLGHQEGDRALIEIASILKEVFRESDIIGRIGGDEFAILAIDTTDESRSLLINRLYNTLDNYNKSEGRKYELSLSIGIAYYNSEKPSSIDDLMAQADTLMYEEKKSKQG